MKALTIILVSWFVIHTAVPVSAANKQKNAEIALQIALKSPTLDDLPLLLEAVKEETHCFPRRSNTVLAIAGLGKEAVPGILARIKMERSKTWKAPVRHTYLLALIGSDAKSALPTLEKLVKAPKCSQYVRSYVAIAKAAIQEDIEELARLATQKKIGWAAALDVLEHMGPDARSAAPIIAARTRREDSRHERYMQTLKVISPSLAEEIAKDNRN